MALRQFLEDKKTREFSATRLAFLLWVVGVLAVWVYASIYQKQLQPVPESGVTILGLLVSGKVVQRFAEQ